MTNKTPSGARKHHKSKSTNPENSQNGPIVFLSSFFLLLQTQSNHNRQNFTRFIRSGSGRGDAMAAFGRNKSMTEKGGLLDPRSTLGEL